VSYKDHVARMLIGTLCPPSRAAATTAQQRSCPSRQPMGGAREGASRPREGSSPVCCQPMRRRIGGRRRAAREGHMVDDRYMSTSPLPTLPSVAPSSSLELSITPPSGPGRKARASSRSLDEEREERGAALGLGPWCTWCLASVHQEDTN
jgi:hypothetical protein